VEGWFLFGLGGESAGGAGPGKPCCAGLEILEVFSGANAPGKWDRAKKSRRGGKGGLVCDMGWEEWRGKPLQMAGSGKLEGGLPSSAPPRKYPVTGEGKKKNSPRTAGRC